MRWTMRDAMARCDRDMPLILDQLDLPLGPGEALAQVGHQVLK